MQELVKIVGVESRLSTAYHPQTDGQTERVNQQIEAYLRIFCAAHPEDWVKYIPDIEFAHNQLVPQGRNESPFFLMMGYNPRAIPSPRPTSDHPSLEQRLSRLDAARKEATAAHELARQRMMERFPNSFTPFTKGQKVWLDAKNLKTVQPTKFSPLREGPFPISEVLGKWTYRLTLPHQWKIHDVFHASLLTPYKETEVHGPNYTNPPPDLVDGNEEYEVETILAHRQHRNQNQYLVKWKGYASADNTWEPEAHLMPNSTDTLLRYKLQHNLRLSPSQANLAKDLDITAQP